ncbi:hypothetical protein QTV43_000076 [Vibrio vulnificus]|nr:hypothetical protein [Vibrio vulnificus]
MKDLFYLTQFSIGDTYVQTDVESLTAMDNTQIKIVEDTTLISSEFCLFEFKETKRDPNGVASYYKLTSVTQNKPLVSGAKVIMCCAGPENAWKQGDIVQIYAHKSCGNRIEEGSWWGIHNGTLMDLGCIENFICIESPLKGVVFNNKMNAYFHELTSIEQSDLQKVISIFQRKLSDKEKLSVTVSSTAGVVLTVLDMSLPLGGDRRKLAMPYFPTVDTFGYKEMGEYYCKCEEWEEIAEKLFEDPNTFNFSIPIKREKVFCSNLAIKGGQAIDHKGEKHEITYSNNSFILTKCGEKEHCFKLDGRELADQVTKQLVAPVKIKCSIPHYICYNMNTLKIVAYADGSQIYRTEEAKAEHNEVINTSHPMHSELLKSLGFENRHWYE